MLREIYCEEFHQKRIDFDDGLNVVLGTNSADNSIGKSTFMLIVDFVFGGSSYARSTDILNNVAPHEICFKFEFNKHFYYFSRINTDSGTVWKCDEKYNRQEALSNENFCKWLSEQYGIDSLQQTFRDVVGRYIRVYGKDNIDEHHPLHANPKEKGDKACISILKLFKRYRLIESLEHDVELTKANLSALRKAQDFKYVTRIGKRDYVRNQQEIERLQNEVENISSAFEEGMLDVESSASEEAIRIKKELSRAKRKRNTIRGRLCSITENIECKFTHTDATYLELQKYFPAVNIRRIEEVEKFHKEISKILQVELKDEKRELLKQLEEYESIIASLEEQLGLLIKDPHLPKIILQKYADQMKLIDKMRNENKIYEDESTLKIKQKAEKNALKNAKGEQFGMLEKMINTEMERINNELYQGRFNAPTIHFTDSNYNFFTQNDTGTGIAYKGLVVFDLSIMHLSSLPILVHDSVVLKQISDEAVEHILEQYIACGKQVIVALDKYDSYSHKTTDILLKYARLRLSPNGGELFGKSWGKR